MAYGQFTAEPGPAASAGPGPGPREHEWLSPARYHPGRPWYQRLTCDDDHKVWLLSWLPGQRAGCPATASRPARSRWRGALRELAAPGRRPGPPVPVPRGR